MSQRLDIFKKLKNNKKILLQIKNSFWLGGGVVIIQKLMGIGFTYHIEIDGHWL